MSKKHFSIQVEGQALYGSLHLPEKPLLRQKEFIVFLHGWAGYRTGPHGMFVSYAQALCALGYHALMFDFRGRGYSQGEATDTTMQSMMSDLEAVMQMIDEAYEPDKITFIGICSGAKLALYYAKSGQRSIHQIVELSSPTLWAGNEAEIERKRTKSLVNTYVRKALEANTWKKMIHGKVNFRKITGMIFHSARKGMSVVKDRAGAKRVPEKRARAFERFAGNILMIHGEKDPETESATGQITAFLKKHEVDHELKIIKGANHSFYGITWKEQIYQAIAHFLNQHQLKASRSLINQ